MEEHHIKIRDLDHAEQAPEISKPAKPIKKKKTAGPKHSPQDVREKTEPAVFAAASGESAAPLAPPKTKQSRDTLPTAPKASASLLSPVPPPDAVSAERELKQFVAAAKLQEAAKRKGRSFDFISFLQYQEPVAGLVVSEDDLKVLLYKTGREGKEVRYASLSLPAGIIQNGALADRPAFVKTLRELWEKLPASMISSVILSLPPERAWFSMMEFPKSLSESKVNEAIKLSLQFSLPVRYEDAYADWQFADEENHGLWRISLASIRKEVVDPYASALREAGITPIAVETHSISLKRTIAAAGTLNSFAAHLYRSGINLMVFRRGAVWFQRFLPWEKIVPANNSRSPIEAAVSEIKRFTHFLAADAESRAPAESLYVFGSTSDAPALREAAKKASLPLEEIAPASTEEWESEAWRTARGAAARGMQFRGDDTDISFAAVGTEQIYEAKRIISFSAFFKQLAVGVSLFFLLLFFGSYLFIANLIRQSNLREIAQLGISQDLLKEQDAARSFNASLAEMSALEKRAPHWERVIKAIGSIANPGITITTLAATDPKGIEITGVAKSRDALLQFKASIGVSGVFFEPELPFSALIEKENVPFRLALKFVNQNYLFQ